MATSPLTRAIETALGIFGEGRSILGKELRIGQYMYHHSTSNVVDPRLRERVDTCCDIGRNPVELQLDFGSTGVVLDNLEDNWWAHDDCEDQQECLRKGRVVKESYTSLDRRIKNFLLYLQERGENHIAIVGHSKFIQRMLKSPVKLRNCELKVVKLSELAHVAPHISV